MNKRAEPVGQGYADLRLSHWGSGSPIVLLVHGYGYTSQVWGGFAAQLASDAHVVAVDWMPGSPQARFADMCAEVGKVMGVLDRVEVVVAQGEGAAAAVDLALRGFTRGLVLFAPTGDSWPPECVVDPTGSVPPHDDPLADEAFAAMGEWVAGLESGDDQHFASAQEHLIEATASAYAQYIEHEDDRALIKSLVEGHFQNMTSQPGLDVSGPYWIDRLRDVRVPVLVAPGSPAIYAALAARAPSGELVPVDSHIPMLWLEKRSQAIEIVRRLLPNRSQASP